MKSSQQGHLAHSLLPDTAFRHIGVMVMFMAILMSFAGFGFIAVTGIISGWTRDIDNTLTVEIPAYDLTTQTIRPAAAMEKLMARVVNTLRYDPLVTSIDVFSDDELNNRMNLAQIPRRPGSTPSEYDIPLPRFITLHLHPDRVDAAVTRLEKSITSISNDIVVKTHKEWMNDINETAQILRIVFGGLAVSILVVTGFIITGVVRTQLKASADTIALFHLMGAQSYTIAALFQRAVISPVAKGAFVGFALGLAILIPLSSAMNLSGFSMNIWLLGPTTFLLFMVLSALTTQWTVLSNLREMP